MIQTQSQNNEIRQIAEALHEVWYQVLWDVGLKVRGKVWHEVRCEVWEKGLLHCREKAIL